MARDQDTLSNPSANPRATGRRGDKQRLQVIDVFESLAKLGTVRHRSTPETTLRRQSRAVPGANARKGKAGRAESTCAITASDGIPSTIANRR